MDADEITDFLVDSLGKDAYDVIICNICNGDMVGLGNLEAGIKACEIVDGMVKRITDMMLKRMEQF